MKVFALLLIGFHSLAFGAFEALPDKAPSIDKPAHKTLMVWVREQNEFLDDDAVDPQALLAGDQDLEAYCVDCAHARENVSSHLGPAIAPVTGSILIQFHDQRRTQHEGIDITAPRGTPVRAAWAGKVQFARCTNGVGGCTVVVKHINGMSTYYAHLGGAPFVHAGENVVQGQVLGPVGNTGNARGKAPQLHFEVRAGRRPLNPLGFIKPTPSAVAGT